MKDQPFRRLLRQLFQMRPTILLLLTLWITSCATTYVRVVPTDPNTTNALVDGSNSLTNSSSPATIFLLERDIPTDIKRLGVVFIYPINTGSKTDEFVKKELQKKCQELGANGAYRVNEGYYPDTRRAEIPYLLFKYAK